MSSGMVWSSCSSSCVRRVTHINIPSNELGKLFDYDINNISVAISDKAIRWGLGFKVSLTVWCCIFGDILQHFDNKFSHLLLPLRFSLTFIYYILITVSSSLTGIPNIDWIDCSKQYICLCFMIQYNSPPRAEIGPLRTYNSNFRWYILCLWCF